MESVKGRTRSRSLAKGTLLEDGKDTEDAVEKSAQKKRQNQVLIIYIFICCIVILAWCLGTWQLSFIWVFCLVVLIFFIWKGKVLALTEQYIKEKALLIHRKRALRHNETTEWLNFIINRWWVFSASTISDIVKKKIDPLLIDVKPSYLESLELESLSFGDKTPFIKYIQVYECADGVGCGKRPLSLSVAMQPPPGLQQAHQFQLVLEVDLGIQCDDFLMILRAKLNRFGVLDIAVEKLNLTGLMQVVVRLDMDAPFPHIASASVSFLEKPEVSFSIRTLRVIPVTEIPFLKSWIYHLVMNGLAEALVDPGKLDFTTTSTGPTKVLSQPQPKALAIGVLTFSIHGEYQKTQEKGKKDKVDSSNHMDLMDDSRYCVVNLGSQESDMPMVPRSEPWVHKDSFLIYNMKTDKLVIDVKSQVLLTTQSLAKFEIGLSSLVFDNNRCSLPLTKQIDEHEIVKLNMSLQRTNLPNIEKSIEEGKVEMTANDSLGGVIYICLHNGMNLLGLDSNGFSDPYCVIYIGGKKLKCTHYVPRTRNPKWEVSAEVIVKDISKAVLSFVVYDWDGRSISEDDFLGSAHILLSQEKPFLIRKNLNLGYNLMAQDSAEDTTLGTICVTAVFRPIPCIGHPQSSGASSNLSTQLSSKPRSPIEKKTKSSRRSPNMPPDAGGMVEIKIIRAKNLVAMDRNGFSDPFCEVKVGGRKRFVTSIKKKTLNPVWDELVTTEIPKQNETLEILVWDHDVLFQKDFLGSLSFTPQQLMQYTGDSQRDEWFSLQRISSGSILLCLKVNAAYNHQLSLVDDSILTTKKQGSSSPPSDLDTSASIQTESELNQSLRSDIVGPADTSKVNGKSALPESSSSQRLTRKFSDSFPNIRKTASEAALNGDLTDKKKDHPEARSSELRSKSASLKNDATTVLSATEKPMDILSSSDFYYGVRGHIIGLTGLQEAVSHAYIKVRLVSRTEENPKKPQAGHILTKSSSFHASPDIKMDVSFEVDRGHGVHKKSLLVFDVKSGRYSHLATRGFSLAEIFKGDQKESTVMLALENAVKVKVKMSFESLVATPGLFPTAHRSHSFLGFRSNTLKKIKEL